MNAQSNQRQNSTGAVFRMYAVVIQLSDIRQKLNIPPILLCQKREFRLHDRSLLIRLLCYVCGKVDRHVQLYLYPLFVMIDIQQWGMGLLPPLT